MRRSGWLLAGILVAGLLPGVPVTLARFTGATAADVVRRDLVARIVEAYDRQK